ncbi:MAG: response regulator [Elusimicrobiota bacterium]
MPDRIYTTFQVSQFCSVDITTVMSWVNQGKLKAYKTPGGHRRIQEQDLVEFFNKYKMPIPDELKNQERRILVVDDDAELLKIILRSLKKISIPFIVETAKDGFSAGQKWVSFKPDLVVLDLYLPGVDGFDICASMKKTEKKKKTKVLAITGYVTPANQKRILDSGANDFLAKPFIPKQLLKKVEQLLAS